MFMSAENMEFQLAERSMLAFRDARDIHLECTEGVVWVTVEEKASDFVLAMGEKLKIECDGKVVIQGLPSCSVKLFGLAAGTIRQEDRLANITSNDLNLSEQATAVANLLADRLNRFLLVFRHN